MDRIIWRALFQGCCSESDGITLFPSLFLQCRCCTYMNLRPEISLKLTDATM